MKFVQSAVKKSIDDVEKEVDNEFLNNIPQYVIEVNNSVVDQLINDEE